MYIYSVNVTENGYKKYTNLCYDNTNKLKILFIYTYVYCTYVYIIESISIARFRRFLISSLDWCIASNNIPIYQICPKSISKNVYTHT